MPAILRAGVNFGQQAVLESQASCRPEGSPIFQPAQANVAMEKPASRCALAFVLALTLAPALALFLLPFSFFLLPFAF